MTEKFTDPHASGPHSKKVVGEYVVKISGDGTESEPAQSTTVDYEHSHTVHDHGHDLPEPAAAEPVYIPPPEDL